MLGALDTAALMHQPARVLFHMGPVDADTHLAILTLYIDVAVGSNWIIVLRNLEALWQVRIIVILPVELGMLLYRAIKSQPHLDGIFHRFAVYYR